MERWSSLTENQLCKRNGLPCRPDACSQRCQGLCISTLLGKAESATRLIKEHHSSLAESDFLHPLPVELGDLQNINVMAKQFASWEKRLNILVNDAALLARPSDKDKNGISISLQLSTIIDTRQGSYFISMLTRVLPNSVHK
jgi:hypothetical protein